jgi:hypothetical protein
MRGAPHNRLAWLMRRIESGISVPILGRVEQCPKAFLARKATAGEYSSIDLPEHDIERADDRRDIGKHVPAA